MTTPSLRARAALRPLAVLVAGFATLATAVAVQAPAAHAAGQTLTAPTAAKSGSTIALGGASWPAYASVNVYLVRSGVNTFMCTVHADSAGAIVPSTCTVPTQLVAGNYTPHADDGHSHTANSAAMTLSPSLALTSTFTNQPTATVAAGSTLGLSGHGFAASSHLTAKLDAATVATTPASPTSDTNGTFSSVTITIPAGQAAGPVVVRVSDAGSHAATYQVIVYRATVSAAASGAGGEQTELSGSGWPAGRSVNAYINNGVSNSFMCTVHSDANGAIPHQDCTVPSFLPAGADSLLLTDTAVTVVRPFALTPALFPTSTFNNQPTTTVAAGSTLALAGHAFAASSALTVTLGTTTLATTPSGATTDANGSFSNVVVTIPAATAAGSRIIKVTDAASNSRTYKLTAYRVAVTAPASGPANVPQVLSGTGWAPGAAVNAYLAVNGSNNFMCTLHADDSGALAPLACNIPSFVPNGAAQLVLTDGFVTGRKAFTVQASISVTNGGGTPLSGAPVGTAVTLAGYGFTASSTVSGKLGTKSLSLVPTSPPTNTNGTFSGVTFAVPNIAAGTYTLTVTDAAGKKGTAQFTVS